MQPLETPDSLEIGHYDRVLVSSNASATSSSPLSSLYEPEGSEYSIYYASKYLYITPDIFTGLLTGLFFFFVFYIGLGRLSANQVGRFPSSPSSESALY
jgi:hypothetical protein